MSLPCTEVSSLKQIFALLLNWLHSAHTQNAARFFARMKHEGPVEQFLTVFVHLCNLGIQASSVYLSLAFWSSILPREEPTKLCLQNSGASLAHSSQLFLLPSLDHFLKLPNYSQVHPSSLSTIGYQFSVSVALLLLWPVSENSWLEGGKVYSDLKSKGGRANHQSWEEGEESGCITFPIRKQRKNKPHSLPQWLTWSSKAPPPVDSTTFQNSTNSCADTLLWKCLLNIPKRIFDRAQSKVNNTPTEII